MKRAAFLICSGIGYLLGHYLPEGAWSAYAPILISYHLYLGYLVVTGEREAGFSMPVFSTILTHSAFLAALIGLAFGRHYVPFFGLIRIFIPGLAPFESQWLFSRDTATKLVPKKTSEASAAAAGTMGSTSETVTTSETVATSEAVITGEAVARSETAPTEVVPAAAAGEYTADEHTAWINYLHRPRRAFRKPGVSVEEEFRQWQEARAQYKAILAQTQHPD